MEPQQIKERAKTLVQAIDEILAGNKKETNIEGMDKVFLETLRSSLQEKQAIVKARFELISDEYDRIEKELSKTDDLVTDIEALIEDIDEILETE